jgi:hypothetical protein
MKMARLGRPAKAAGECAERVALPVSRTEGRRQSEAVVIYGRIGLAAADHYVERPVTTLSLRIANNILDRFDA